LLIGMPAVDATPALAGRTGRDFHRCVEPESGPLRLGSAIPGYRPP